jgi:hypothetical protein
MSGKLLTGCLCLLATILVVPCYGDTNILTNPGFEEGITGWSNGNCSISADTNDLIEIIDDWVECYSPGPNDCD